MVVFILSPLERLAGEADRFNEVRQTYIEGNMPEDEFLEEAKKYILTLQMYQGESVFCNAEELLRAYLEKDKLNKNKGIQGK